MKYLLSIFLLVGCITPPYQPFNGHGGYSETSIGNNRFQVIYRGLDRQDSQTVSGFAINRAQEICFKYNRYTVTIHKWDVTKVKHTVFDKPCVNSSYSNICKTNRRHQFVTYTTVLIVSCK